MAKLVSLNEILNQLSKALVETQKNEVAETVRDEEQRQIQKLVYESYGPTEYERRYDSDGGLQDRKMMVAVAKKNKNGSELIVTNVAKGQDEPSLDIASLVEYGHNNGHGSYQYPTSRDFLDGRPFTEATIEALEKSGAHVEAHKKGLHKRGFKTL